MDMKAVWNIDPALFERIFAYRYEMACMRLKWLPPNDEKKEHDRYDFLPNTHHLLITDEEDNGCILAYMRAIRGKCMEDFMLGNEFLDMITEPAVREEFSNLIARSNCIEVTRFLPNTDLPREDQRQVRYFSYGEMVRWAYEQGVDYIILFTTLKIPPDLEKGGLSVPIVRRCGAGYVVLAIDVRSTTERNSKANS